MAADARLAEVLAALDRGEAPATVLARFPDDAEVLAPFLAVAGALPALGAAPDPVEQAASRRAFLARAADLRRQGAPVRRRRLAWPRWLLGPVTGVAMTAAVVALLAGMALPGDGFYPVKQAGEQAWLAAVPAGTPRAAAQRRLAERRVAEARALLAAGRSAAVTLEGPIDAVRPDAWVVSGLVAQFDPGTRILGTPEVGETARLWGRTEDGRLLVDTIVCDPPPGMGWGTPPVSQP